MSTVPVDYEAVIADLEAKIAHLQTTLAGIRVIAGMGGLGITPSPGSPSGGGAPVINGTKPAADAFLGKSIPEAAKMYLTSQRRKLSTQELMDALEAGGLPGSKYNTVYAILSRRENKVGDIINMKGDWALAEWYPNYVKKSKKDAVSLNPKTFDASATEDEGPDEDAMYEAEKERKSLA
jgi:hypothetical protein